MSLLPDSYDYSTQPQTQTQTQAASQLPTAAHFPRDLWGLLLSCSPSATQMDLALAGQTVGVTDNEPFVERASRVEFMLGQNEYTVGRFPKSDLVLNGKKISSHHARIFLDVDEEVKLMDLSTNGTFVRGQKVSQNIIAIFKGGGFTDPAAQVGKNKVTILESGDEIIFGPASASFVNDFRYIFQAPTLSPDMEMGGDGGGIHVLYDVREQIGKGSFATVRRGIQRGTGKVS